jgi:glycosyltransferase involved in cell wall biosynthesis
MTDRAPGPALPTVDLSHGARLDPRDWLAGYQAGEYPEPVAYGLHRLEEHGFRVVQRPRPTGTRRLLNGVGYRIDMMHWGYAFPPVRSRHCDVSLAWDERTGIPTALTNGKRPVVSGCIWTTDDIAPHAWHVRALRRMARVFASSEAQLPSLIRLGLARRNVRYIPMAVSTDFYRPVEVPESAGLVASVGRDRHRDYPTLLRAIADLNAPVRSGEARLELVTPNPVAVPERLGCRIPHLSATDLRALYCRAAVVAIATFPNQHVSGATAVLEAMACGRAVVATANPGLEAYVHSGVDGILVPPGDPEAMAEAIRGLLADPARRREMGRAARENVVRAFSTSIMSENLALLLREVT